MIVQVFHLDVEYMPTVSSCFSHQSMRRSIVSFMECYILFKHYNFIFRSHREAFSEMVTYHVTLIHVLVPNI